MMPTIYIRNFPDDLHRELRLAAVKRDVTLREVMIEATRLWLKTKRKK